MSWFVVSNQGLNPFSLTLGPVPFPCHSGSQVSIGDVVYWEDRIRARRIGMRAPNRSMDWGLWEQEEAKELTPLWDWEAFPAEVTFELGHLVFCRAAARFCLV